MINVPVLFAAGAAVVLCSLTGVFSDEKSSPRQWRQTQRLAWVHTPRLKGLVFSPDGQRLATVGGINEVMLHDPSGARPARVLDGHVDDVRCVAWSPDGQTLATGGGVWNERGSIVLWDANTAKPRRVLHAGRGMVLTLAFAPDSKTLAIGCGYKHGDEAVGDLLLLDIESGQVAATLPEHGGPILSLAFSPDGSSLVAAGYHLANDVEVYTVNLWDVETQTKRRTLRTDHGHFHGLCAVAWSPDGRFIAASGRNGSDGRVVVWTSAGAPWAELPNHVGTVWSLAFSPDSRTLAAGDAAQRAVRLWDIQTGQEQARLQAFPGAVFGLAFSADGRRLAAGGTDGQNGVLVQWECPVAE